MTVSQMPSHTHDVRYGNPGTGEYFNIPWNGSGNGGGYVLNGSWVNNTANNLKAVSTGGGSAQNNMPAYQTLYAWRRTA